MDSRHQSIEQETLNNLVHAINYYVLDNIDEVVSKEDLQEEMKEISFHIYSYAKQWVDIEGIFSKKNLLSIDTILLPNVGEEFVGSSHGGFAKVIKEIEAVIDSHENKDYQNFQNKMRVILKR